MSESLETYTCGVMTNTPSLSSKGVRPLDHLREGITHPSASNYSEGNFSNSSHPRIHCYAVLEKIYSRHPNITFVLSYAPTRPSILPVFKRPAACFDPSRHQSLAPPAHVLYRRQLTHHVLLSSILSLLDAILYNTYTNCMDLFFTITQTMWLLHYSLQAAERLGV